VETERNQKEKLFWQKICPHPAILTHTQFYLTHPNFLHKIKAYEEEREILARDGLGECLSFGDKMSL